MIRAVLIDLDGTLVDTAGDLAEAANRMLAALGRPPCTVAQVQTFVGKGIARLVERCLAGSLEARVDPRILGRALELFGTAYEASSGEHSRVYPGVREGLAALEAQGLALACVTNKAARFTGPLLERMGLAAHFRTVVCVPYGYHEGRPVQSLECDAIVADLAALAEYVRAHQ